MALKRKTSSLNRVAAAEVDAKVMAYGRDLENWPRSWMGLEEDVLPGEQIVAFLLQEFLHHLASSSLSPNTIRRHVDSLWLLGGEIIRHLHDDPSLRKLPAERLVRNAIDAGAGPLIYHGSAEDQRSLDSTCRKLNRFLSHSSQ